MERRTRLIVALAVLFLGAGLAAWGTLVALTESDEVTKGALIALGLVIALPGLLLAWAAWLVWLGEGRRALWTGAIAFGLLLAGFATLAGSVVLLVGLLLSALVVVWFVRRR